jgi:hypothetical protein
MKKGQELDSNWSLMKMGVKGVPTREAWIKENIKAGGRVCGIILTL